MKNYKYYVIFGISLIACIYVIAFMPSVPLKEDHADELWFADADEWTEFYIDGVQQMDEVKDQYKGNVPFNDLKMQLDISIGKLQEINRIYTRSEDVYNVNQVSLYEDFGINNYIEFTMLYDSMQNLFSDKSNNKVLSAKVVNDTCTNKSDGLVFEVQVLYTNAHVQTLIVKFFNEQQQPIGENSNNNILPTILKILPKVEG